MLSLPLFEVRIDMASKGAKSYSQMFIGKPTLEEVLERVRGLPHEDYWVDLLIEHGLPRVLFTYATHSEYIGFCKHMDVAIARIRVIRHPSLPVADEKFHMVIQVVNNAMHNLSKEYFDRGGKA